MNVLLVEDEPELAAYIIRGLTEAGHHVDHAARGDRGFQLASEGRYDLLIVDRMLPGMDGLTLVKALREKHSNLPVLFLSNLGGLDDRVEGLNSGGDDYLAKPFAFTELLARVNALLRRPQLTAQPTTLRLGDLEMDLIKRRVTRAEREIDLQPREFSLLEYLMRRPDQIVTRTMLLEGVWNYHFDPKTNIVETHISRLRSKSDREIIDRRQNFLATGETIRAEDRHLVLTLPVRARFRGGRAVVIDPTGAAGNAPQPDMALVKAIARAHRWRQMLLGGEATSIEALAKRFEQDRGHTARTLNLAFLSPTITRAIIRGEQPPGLRLTHLLDADIPLSWHEQEAIIARL